MRIIVDTRVIKEVHSALEELLIEIQTGKSNMSEIEAVLINVTFILEEQTSLKSKKGISNE